MANKIKKEAPTAHDAPVEHSQHQRWLVTIVAASVVIIGTFIGALVVHFQNRALPNTMLGNIAVGGKTKEEIHAIAEAQAKQISITFQNGEEKVPATLADVGVSIDVDKTVNEVLNTRRNWLDIILAWQPKTVPLAYTSDLGVAKIFAKEHFPALVSDAQDAQLTFNNSTKQFDIKPGAPGKGFDVVGFVQTIEKLTVTPEPVVLQVNTSPVQPVIQEKRLETIQTEANQAAALSIKFVYDGKVRYTAAPEDIAGWTHFIPAPTKNSVDIEYDLAAIQQFLAKKVGPSIAAPAIDRKVVHDPNSGKDVVIQAGQEGRQLADADKLANEILASLSNNTPFEQAVTVTTAPFKTVTMTGTDHWVEVDLSEQRLNLYIGSERIATYLISSGVAKHPTVTGEFRVRAKVVKQTMTGGSRATGDYYSTPNVRWVSYFYEDYGIHGAWWHNNFGHPMSHGCINMRDADAKVVYDFAPIGTKVIVHS